MFSYRNVMSQAQAASKIRGVQLAIVIDNKDGDGNPGYHVKVKFPWLSEQESTFWARIVVPMAGADRGTYVLPEIDDQLLVVFEHGEVDRPLVIGALWSKKQEPVEVNDSAKNNTKLIKSRCGHRIIFDDKQGAEKITIVDKTKKNKIVLDSVNKIVKIESAGDIEIKAKTNVIMHSNALKVGTSNGVTGKGQSLLRGPADVSPAWDYAMQGGRVAQSRIIVEGFIDFDYEITQLTVRAVGAGGQIETHFCEPIGHIQVSGDYVESWQPHRMTPAALQRSRDIAQAVTDNLGGQGLFGVELFVKGDMVWFSEVSPRPHDTGMVTMITQWQNEFELHARAILGLPVNTALKSPGASAVIYGGVDAKGIAFDGVDEALRVPNTELRLFGKPESFVKRRMGVALAFDADVETARRNAKAAAVKVKPRQA